VTHLQEEFLHELKSKEKFAITDYTALYDKDSTLVIEYEENNGVSEHQAKAMGKYYTTSVLPDFVDNENLLARIIALHESDKK
jgi:hypothetical protein